MTVDDFLKPFTLRIWVKAPCDVLHKAWANSSELERWFVHRAQYFGAKGEPVPNAVKGGTYRWEWIEGTNDEAKVIDAEETKIRFGWYSNRGWVEVRLEPHGDETLVELSQGMDEGTEDERLSPQVDCKLGWTFFLANLKSVYEGGIDLRETDPTRVPVLNY